MQLLLAGRIIKLMMLTYVSLSRLCGPDSRYHDIYLNIMMKTGGIVRVSCIELEPSVGSCRAS